MISKHLVPILGLAIFCILSPILHCEGQRYNTRRWYYPSNYYQSTYQGGQRQSPYYSPSTYHGGQRRTSYLSPATYQGGQRWTSYQSPSTYQGGQRWTSYQSPSTYQGGQRQTSFTPSGGWASFIQSEISRLPVPAVDPRLIQSIANQIDRGELKVVCIHGVQLGSEPCTEHVPHH